MFWVILWFTWSFLDEITNTIIKKQKLKYNIIQIWFITLFFALLFFILYAAIKTIVFSWTIHVNPESYLFLFIRVILEIFQS